MPVSASTPASVSSVTWGSDLRFDYSVLGDSVNLASRLEGQTKSYGVRIIIGSMTAQLIEDKFAFIELDQIRVKGKSEPEIIYALLGRQDLRDNGSFQEVSSKMSAMIENYRNRNWSKALPLTRECRKLGAGFGLDAVAAVYEERIKSYRRSPPPKHWDGVYVATTK